MGNKVFVPVAEEVLARIDELFSYIRSGILINTVEENNAQVATNPFLAAFIPYIVRAVYIDTPNREITVAAVKYPKGLPDNFSEYYVLLHEELYGMRRNTLVAECTEEEFRIVVKKINEILGWYRDNRSNIEAVKLGVLKDLLEKATGEGKSKLKEIIDSIMRADIQ